VAEEQAKAFRLGVAAAGWDDLLPRLKEKGIGEAAVVKAGLLVEKDDGRSYDRFRGRLMFPIAGLDGQVIGFGGRAMGEEKGAKYINTPETPLYKKSRVLYGLDLAREAIRKTRSAVLVEGYFDVIGLHQAGVKNAVAVCGTALTPEHVELLKRCDCREVTVLFDGDSAGLAAPAKAAAALLPSGLSGKVALLPAGEAKLDPDDFARAHGKAGLDALLSAAQPLSQFLIDRAVEKTCGREPRTAALEAKLAAVAELAPLVKLAPEGLARGVFEEAVARKLDLDLEALRRELAGARPARVEEPPATDDGPPGEAGWSAPGGGGWRRDRRPGPAPAGASSQRVQAVLPGPAVDALGLLIAFPDLAPVAAEESLPSLLPAGALADLARLLLREPVSREAALARLAEADPSLRRRVEALTGPGGVERGVAEGLLRRAAVKAAIAAVVAQQERCNARIARGGSPVADDLRIEAEVAMRRRAELEKRLRGLERAG
jgi:DNA primase